VDETVIRIGDCSNRLKTWFGNYPASVVVLRPDRFVAALAVPQTLGKVCSALRQALSALVPGQPVDRAGALRKVA
jgi:3-(3-hydroxy-phenyl)propionate hydroxylase